MLTLLSRFFRALPLPWALAVARAVAWVWYYLIPLRRRVAHANVKRALGTRLTPAAQRRVVRRCFANLCMYAVEGLRMPLLTRALSEELVETIGMHHMDALLARGKGIVGVTAHLGNFDLLGTSQAVRGYPINAILKDIHWAPAQKLWDEVRTATGLKRIAPRRSKEDVKAALARNEVVAFLVDQHMAPFRSIVCTFFGQLASTSPAPVRFALETGAPMITAVTYRQDNGGHHIVIMEPEFILEMPYANQEANIRHNTERLNRKIEGWICDRPEQWLWLHKRWKVHDAPAGWDIPPDLQHLVETPR